MLKRRQAKRRKLTPDTWMREVRKWARSHPQEVEMRIVGYGWEVRLGNAWLRVRRAYVRDDVTRRCGNLWAKRMGWTPKWVDG